MQSDLPDNFLTARQTLPGFCQFLVSYVKTRWYELRSCIAEEWHRMITEAMYGDEFSGGKEYTAEDYKAMVDAFPAWPPRRTNLPGNR